MAADADPRDRDGHRPAAARLRDDPGRPVRKPRRNLLRYSLSELYPCAVNLYRTLAVAGCAKALGSRMITVTDVSKDYHSETRHTYHRVLSNVSFVVGPGEKIAVLGANGAGKSTLIRLVAGVELPTVGSIERTMSVSS